MTEQDISRYQDLIVTTATDVGIKMLAASWLKSVLGKNFNLYVLGVIIGILAAGVVFSWGTSRHREPDGSTDD